MEAVINKHMMKVLSVLALLWANLPVASAQTQDDVALAEFARKAQDPLGNVKALMTDNTISFDGGPNEDTSYGFQLQLVIGHVRSQWLRPARSGTAGESAFPLKGSITFDRCMIFQLCLNLEPGWRH